MWAQERSRLLSAIYYKALHALVGRESGGGETGVGVGTCDARHTHRLLVCVCVRVRVTHGGVDTCYRVIQTDS